MSTPGVLLAVWSGPRNISTALMRSWDQRSDCRVVDEPLYPYFLAQTGIDHPGRDEVVAMGETNWEKVVAEITAPSGGVYYQKHMAHHLIPQLPRDWISLLTNVLLIRDPFDVLTSYVRKRGEVTDTDVGLPQQVEILDQLGGDVPVIDAADFLGDPESYLRWLCAHIGVEFNEVMLSWPPGPSPSDGVWGRHWYGEVTASSCFANYHRNEAELPPDLQELGERLMVPYERLHGVRVVL